MTTRSISRIVAIRLVCATATICAAVAVSFASRAADAAAHPRASARSILSA